VLRGLGNFVEITVEPHLTTTKLQRLSREGGYQVWHFVGHGGFDQHGMTARLAFEEDTGDIMHINVPELGVLLHHSNLRLVMLNACRGAQLATDPFRSLAPALVRGHIPAVIAMQFSAPEETTRVFASEFYQALAEGRAPPADSEVALVHLTRPGKSHQSGRSMSSPLQRLPEVEHARRRCRLPSDDPLQTCLLS